jgi:hypothetical protein
MIGLSLPGAEPGREYGLSSDDDRLTLNALESILTLAAVCNLLQGMPAGGTDRRPPAAHPLERHARTNLLLTPSDWPVIPPERLPCRAATWPGAGIALRSVPRRAVR